MEVIVVVLPGESEEDGDGREEHGEADHVAGHPATQELAQGGAVLLAGHQENVPSQEGQHQQRRHSQSHVERQPCKRPQSQTTQSAVAQNNKPIPPLPSPALTEWVLVGDAGEDEGEHYHAVEGGGRQQVVDEGRALEPLVTHLVHDLLPEEVLVLRLHRRLKCTHTNTYSFTT